MRNLRKKKNSEANLDQSRADSQISKSNEHSLSQNPIKPQKKDKGHESRTISIG